VLAALPADVTLDTSTVRFAICGAATTSAELVARFEQRCRFPLIEGYGLSEGTCASTINPPDDPRAGTVVVLDDMPKNPVGKTDKAPLRAAHAAPPAPTPDQEATR
jgi:acyl-CoA synthetase (AMP-forming)/AMP-acid ligase II